MVYQSQDNVSEDTSCRRATFLFALMSLGAKLAAADGQVRKEEFQAFRRLFPIPRMSSSGIYHLFMMAGRNNTGIDYFARLISGLFPRREALYLEILDRLCRIARADGPMNATEETELKIIAENMGISEKQWQRTIAHYSTSGASDPYVILGVEEAVTTSELKKTYRRLAQAYHPDKAVWHGLNEEEVISRSQHLAAINEAYNELLRRRKDQAAG